MGKKKRSKFAAAIDPRFTGKVQDLSKTESVPERSVFEKEVISDDDQGFRDFLKQQMIEYFESNNPPIVNFIPVKEWDPKDCPYERKRRKEDVGKFKMDDLLWQLSFPEKDDPEGMKRTLPDTDNPDESITLKKKKKIERSLKTPPDTDDPDEIVTMKKKENKERPPKTLPDKDDPDKSATRKKKKKKRPQKTLPDTEDSDASIMLTEKMNKERPPKKKKKKEKKQELERFKEVAVSTEWLEKQAKLFNS